MWRKAGPLCLLGLLGCGAAHARSPSQPGEGGNGGEAGSPEPAVTSVDLGTPGGEDGLEFLPLSDGAQLNVQTFGQGGTHVLVGVRCSGFGSRAFVSAELENLASGVVVTEPAPARPQLLYCGDSGDCDLVPYLVHVSGLTKTDAEKDGLAVRLTVLVRNEAGVNGQCSRQVVLSTAEL